MRVLGKEKAFEIFNETVDIENMGGMKTFVSYIFRGARW